MSAPPAMRCAGLPGACYQLSRRWRCGRKSVQTRRSPKAVAGPQSRATTKYGPICAATPGGWGQFSPFRRHSSLEDTPYSSLLVPRTEKNWLPAPPAGKLITGSSCARSPQSPPPECRGRQSAYRHAASPEHSGCSPTQSPRCGSSSGRTARPLPAPASCRRC